MSGDPRARVSDFAAKDAEALERLERRTASADDGHPGAVDLQSYASATLRESQEPVEQGVDLGFRQGVHMVDVAPSTGGLEAEHLHLAHREAFLATSKSS